MLPDHITIVTPNHLKLDFPYKDKAIEVKHNKTNGIDKPEQ